MPTYVIMKNDTPVRIHIGEEKKAEASMERLARLDFERLIRNYPAEWNGYQGDGTNPGRLAYREAVHWCVREVGQLSSMLEEAELSGEARDYQTEIDRLHQTIDALKEEGAKNPAEPQRLEEHPGPGGPSLYDSVVSVIYQELAEHVAEQDERSRLATRVAKRLTVPQPTRDLDEWAQWDGTDGAHPSWWRGQDDGVRGATERVKHALEVDLDLRQSGTLGYKPLQEVVDRILALRRHSLYLRTIVGSHGISMDASLPDDVPLERTLEDAGKQGWAFSEAVKRQWAAKAGDGPLPAHRVQQVIEQAETTLENVEASVDQMRKLLQGYKDDNDKDVIIKDQVAEIKRLRRKLCDDGKEAKGPVYSNMQGTRDFYPGAVYECKDPDLSDPVVLVGGHPEDGSACVAMQRLDSHLIILEWDELGDILEWPAGRKEIPE